MRWLLCFVMIWLNNCCLFDFMNKIIMLEWHASMFWAFNSEHYNHNSSLQVIKSRPNKHRHIGRSIMPRAISNFLLKNEPILLTDIVINPTFNDSLIAITIDFAVEKWLCPIKLSVRYHDNYQDIRLRIVTCYIAKIF